MDWDLIVLIAFLTTTVAGFAWRRTRIKMLYYVWLGLMQLEIAFRKERDRRDGPRNV
jgi:hypothetical protein